MDGKRGQFLSQDPVFWEMGQGTPDSVAVLRNPQAQNSYSYGQNNPIVNKDPDGRIAFGFGFSGTGNLPGMYGEASTYAVLTISGSGIEVGIISSGEGGGSTAFGGAGGTAGLLFSNARNISELEGGEAVFGGSARAIGDIGVDVGLSKANNSNRRIVTVNPSVGFGIVGTPYVLPVEIHGGGGYSKAIASKNITQGVKNAANSAQSSIQKQLNNIANQIKEIQKQIDKIKSKSKSK